MSKHWQESRIEFRRMEDVKSSYPIARGVVVHQYGGSIEECIEKARKEFNLGPEWKVIKAEGAK